MPECTCGEFLWCDEDCPVHGPSVIDYELEKLTNNPPNWAEGCLEEEIVRLKTLREKLLSPKLGSFLE